MDPPPSHADPLARPDPRCEAVYSICSSALNFVVGLQMPFSVGLQMPCCCCLCCCCVGRKCLSVCNTVCCFVPLHRCRRINAMSVPHTHRDTQQPRPTCEIRPTGMSLLEGEGWPSQVMRRVAPRRREAIVLGPVRCKDVWPPIATRSM